MSSIDFDEVLKVVGEKGRFQTVFFFILCIPATFPVAFLAFSNVFTSAAPDHWCRPPEALEEFNLTQSEIRNIVIPFRVRADGEKIFEKCVQYDVDSILNKSFDEFRNNVSSLRNTISGGSLDTKKCDRGWIYETKYYERTLVTESDLVCDESWWPQLSISMFYVGSFFGNVIFGWVADRWGRRNSILCMIYLEVPLAIFTSFFKNYYAYTFLRFLGGFFFPSMFQIPFVLGIEMMAPKSRTAAGMIISSLFATALCLLALLAYLLKDWFKLSLAISIPFVSLYSYYWFLPESPRWLLSKGRIDEAEEILQTIAKYNGATIEKRFLHRLQEECNAKSTPNSSNQVIIPRTSKDIFRRKSHDCQFLPIEVEKAIRPSTYPIGKKSINLDKESLLEISSNKPDVILKNEEIAKVRSVALQTDPVLAEEGSLLDIFRYPNIRKKFLLTTFIWIINGVVYNSLSYNTSNLGVNDFLAFFISAIIEIPSYILSYLIMEKWGRQFALTVTMGLGAIGCVAYVFVPEEFVWVTVSLAMLGKFGTAASLAVFYVFVGELLPTVIRSQAMGLASVFVSIGLLTPPLIIQLIELSRVLPFVVLGVLSILGCIASIFLPETLNTPMPQSLQDGEDFGKEFKIFRRRRRSKNIAVTNL